jgi:hypothetical protein
MIQAAGASYRQFVSTYYVLRKIFGSSPRNSSPQGPRYSWRHATSQFPPWISCKLICDGGSALFVKSRFPPWKMDLRQARADNVARSPTNQQYRPLRLLERAWGGAEVEAVVGRAVTSLSGSRVAPGQVLKLAVGRRNLHSSFNH